VSVPRSLAGVPFARRRTFAQGEFLVQAECPADAMYLIRGGYVRCFLLDDDGHETSTAILGRGQIVGIAPFLGRASHAEFAEAVTRVDAWILPTLEVRRHLPTLPLLQGLAFGCLAQRVELVLALLRGVRLLSVRERIVDMQTRLSASVATASKVKGTTLAALLQIRPETLARVQHLPAARAAPSPVLLPASSTSERRPYATGEVVIDGGLPAGKVGVVVSGEMQFYLTDSRGHSILVDSLEASDLLVAAALLDVPPVRYRLVGASTGEIEVWDTNRLLRWLAEDPVRCTTQVHRLAERLERLERALARASLPNVQAHLTEALRDIADQERVPVRNGARLVPATWSHAALARHLGVCRETITRALAALARQGAIDRQGHRIYLLQKDSTSTQRTQQLTVRHLCSGVPTMAPSTTRRETPASLTSAVTDERAGRGPSSRQLHPRPPSRDRCRLCTLRTSGPLCGGCAERLERDLERNPDHACPDCGRHRELCQVQPCRAEPVRLPQPERTWSTWIRIDNIDEPASQQNSRRTYPDASIAELASSLRQHGFLQPLCVRPRGERYELVFGVRRLRAAMQAGLQEVPCTIRVADDARAFLLNATENLHREQLSNAERVATIERLAATGLGVREIGRRTGFNPSTISRWLRINARPELKRALENGKLDVARAVILVEAPKSSLAGLIDQAPTMPAAQLRRQVASINHGTSARSGPLSEDDGYLLEALRCLRASRVTQNAELIRCLQDEVNRLAAEVRIRELPISRRPAV
jgi:ParB/RepB/Spo0J family partition protein